MSVRSALIRFVAPLVLAVSVSAAPAFAKTQACSGAFCAHSQYDASKKRHIVYFSFNGTHVHHYNVRFKETGGQTVQREVGTYKNDSNWSDNWYVRAIRGNYLTLTVQACSKGGLFGKSKCTGWTTIRLKLA
ncbi:MAG: hypothetical protein KIT16_08585 [Rhodospirillaceae bacterium]|nr:hypothetical protein [Rhodospirillaceae bacterium]